MTPARSPWRAVGRETFSFLRMLVVLSVLLTFISTRFSDNMAWPVMVRVFALNLVFGACIGGVMWSAYSFIFPRLCHGPVRAWRYLGTHALLITVGGVLGVEAAIFAKGLFPWTKSVHIERLPAYEITFVFGIVIVSIFTTIERLKMRALRSEEQLEKARQEALHAQLEALQARTNPHFLFNSLNTVAGLIEEDPKRAEQVLERFSELLRYSLTSSGKDRVPLTEELDVVRGYLDVEGLRLGDRLRARVDVAEGIGAIPVPPLILQPLAENAVLHGIAHRREGGALAVRAARVNGSLELVVEDDGPGPGHSNHAGTRTGLVGLRKRLELAYQGRAVVEMTEPEGGGCRVRLTLPLDGPVAGARPEGGDA